MRLILAILVFLAVPAFSLANPPAPLQEPLKTVVNDYLAIAQQLSNDSIDGVSAKAADMKKVVEADAGKTFQPDFAKAVDQLAAAPDLHSTRIALKPVSTLLIAALARDHAQTGMLHAAFCPMVKAGWLQEDGKALHNPYMGTMMPDCGTFQEDF